MGEGMSNWVSPVKAKVEKNQTGRLGLFLAGHEFNLTVCAVHPVEEESYIDTTLAFKSFKPFDRSLSANSFDHSVRSNRGRSIFRTFHERLRR